jgi:hypothetical protein
MGLRQVGKTVTVHAGFNDLLSSFQWQPRRVSVSRVAICCLYSLRGRMVSFLGS